MTELGGKRLTRCSAPHITRSRLWPLISTLPFALQLNQPLPFDVRAGEWRAELHRWTPSLTHAGIEQLSIAFSQVTHHLSGAILLLCMASQQCLWYSYLT